MKRIVLLSVFALCAGCAVRQTRTSPQKTVTTSFNLRDPDLSRKITLDEIDKPIRFEAPDVVIDRNAPPVTREDLIGKWKGKVKMTVRCVDITNRNEDVKTTEEVLPIIEFKADGTCVGNNSANGVWAYDGTILRIGWGEGMKFLRMKWAKDGRLVQWFDDATWDEMVKTWQKRESTERWDVRYSPLIRDSEFCWRYYRSTFSKGTLEEVCRMYSVSGPAILSRVDGKAENGEEHDRPGAVSRALSDERKKNLDSLLKAGVITEDEYKKEMEKAK